MHTTSTVASNTEIFLLKKFAPELLSKAGKVSVLFIFMIMTGFALYGWFRLKIDFTFEYFVTDEDA